MEQYRSGDGKDIEWDRQPRLRFRILYSSHDTASDISVMENEVGAADVYVPEAAGWSQRYADVLRAVSDGSLEPNQVTIGNNSEFDKKLLGILYGTHIPIEVIDIPSEDALLTEVISADENTNKALENPQDLESMINTLRQALEASAKAQVERERSMISRAQNDLLTNILRDYPHLRSKSDIKVLMTLGAAHTRVGHELESSGLAVQRAFSHGQYTFDLLAEALRRFMFAKPVDDELLARGILQSYLSDLYDHELSTLALRNDSAYSLYIRHMAQQFTLDEIRRLFDGYPELKDEDALFADLERAVIEKGTSIPPPRRDEERVSYDAAPGKTRFETQNDEMMADRWRDNLRNE